MHLELFLLFLQIQFLFYDHDNLYLLWKSPMSYYSKSYIWDAGRQAMRRVFWNIQRTFQFKNALVFCYYTHIAYKRTGKSKRQTMATPFVRGLVIGIKSCCKYRRNLYLIININNSTCRQKNVVFCSHFHKNLFSPIQWQ